MQTRRKPEVDKKNLITFLLLQIEESKKDYFYTLSTFNHGQKWQETLTNI